MPSTRSRARNRNTRVIDFSENNDKGDEFSFKRKRSAADDAKTERRSNKRQQLEGPTASVKSASVERKEPIVAAEGPASEKQSVVVSKEDVRIQTREDELAAGLDGEKRILFEALCSEIATEVAEAEKLYSGSQQVALGFIVAAFERLKREYLAFLQTNDPKDILDKTPNEINTKNQKKITALQKKLSKLQAEQQKWLKILDENKENPPTEISPPTPSLSASEEVDKAQQDIFSKITSLPSKLGVIESSVHTLNRMIMSAEVKQKETFGAFHSSEFQRFPAVTAPKTILKGFISSASS